MNYFKAMSLKVKILVIGLIVFILLLFVLLFLISQKNQIPGQSEVEKLPPSQQVGNGDLYSKEVKKDQSQNKDFYQKGEKITDFRNSLPIKKDGFEVSYSISDGSYIVKLTGQDKEKAKKDFLDYLKGQGLREKDISIFYNTSDSDFVVIDSSVKEENKVLSVAEPVKINFSVPIDQPSAVITIEPDVPAYFDYNSSFTEVTIKPIQGWGFDRTIKITVSAQSQDKNGGKLPQDYIYTFKTPAYSGI